MKQNCPKALFPLQVKHDAGFLPKVKLCVYSFWSSGVGRIWVCLFQFYVCFLSSSPLFFFFSFPIFSFAGYLLLILVINQDSLKSFHENPRKRIFWRTLIAILVLGTRYSLEVLGQHDMYLVFAFFSCLSGITLILVWFERSFPCAGVRNKSYLWLLKLFMSQGVQGLCMRFECIKIACLKPGAWRVVSSILIWSSEFFWVFWS